MSLPREIQLIINDIHQQSTHTLEWELFGSPADDMRLVLTWRKFDPKRKQKIPGKGISKWKLRQASITSEDGPLGKELTDGGKIKFSFDDGSGTMSSNGKWDSKKKGHDKIGDWNTECQPSQDSGESVKVEEILDDESEKKSEDEDAEKKREGAKRKDSNERRKREEEEEEEERKQEKKEREENKKKVEEKNEEKKKKTNSVDEGKDDELKSKLNKKKNPFKKLKKMSDDKGSKSKPKGKLQQSKSIEHESDVSQEPGSPAVKRRSKFSDGGSKRGSKRNSLYDEPIKEMVNEELSQAAKSLDGDQELPEDCRSITPEDDGSEECDSQSLENEEKSTAEADDRRRQLERARSKFRMSIDESGLDDAELDRFKQEVIETTARDNLKTQSKSESEKMEKDTNTRIVHPLNDLPAVTGWSRCPECQYNGFCDDLQHKAEYLTMLIEDFKAGKDDGVTNCACKVCNGGAVHNGCVFRELKRLKHDYKLFDRRNLCLCRVCVPFKYRHICLREELKIMRKEGKDIYYRLTFDGDDKNEGYHPPRLDSTDSSYNSDNDEINDAMNLDEMQIELSKEDKISFRGCMECQFNGFCDDIRHKKLYKMLLHIDYEDIDELEETCGCLVCEFKGAAHSGCALREIRRLKYDVKMFDKRNLCQCRKCVPFKYRSVCLRQEMMTLLQHKGIDLYEKL